MQFGVHRNQFIADHFNFNFSAEGFKFDLIVVNFKFWIKASFWPSLALGLAGLKSAILFLQFLSVLFWIIIGQQTRRAYSPACKSKSMI